MALLGIQYHDNPGNRFRAIRIHYTADPNKRKPDWKNRTKLEYSEAAWDQEQEISFGSYAGRGIYRREFVNDLVENGGHVLTSYELTNIRPIYRVWDFGYHHPAVAFIQEDGSGHHIIFDELMGDDIFIHNFVPLALEKTDGYTGQYSGIVKDYCDRAGTQTKSTGKSDIEVLHEFGIHPSYSQFDLVSSIDYVRRALKIRRADNKPVLLVVGDNCPIIRAGFAGGYRYPPKTKEGKSEKEIPLKDGYYEHLQDCVRYYVSHRLRFLRATMEVIDGKLRSENAEGRDGSINQGAPIQQILIRGSRVPGGRDLGGRTGRFTEYGDSGQPQIPTTESYEDDGDEARYAQDGRLLPSAVSSSKAVQDQREIAGGVMRRQIMVGYNPIGGPAYSRYR